jgi:hypothetical protein
MSSTTFNCPIAKVSVIVWRQYLGDASGIGDEVMKPQYDFQCERKNLCASAGLIQMCPLHVLRRR